MGLKELKEAMSTCVMCGLCEDRTQVVFGEGPPTARVMFVGEAPGEDEDYIGKPFVGKAGQKLDKMIQYAGLDRDEVYITNSVLCRPPNNRTPNEQELDACHWRLMEEINLINPEIVVVLGKTAYEQLLGTKLKSSLSSHFSNDFKDVTLEDGSAIDVLVTFHPSYHLRSPDIAYKVSLPHWTLLKTWVASKRLELQGK